MVKVAFVVAGFFCFIVRCKKCLFSSFNDVRESRVTGLDDS